jgi:hypothetical protein
MKIVNNSGNILDRIRNNYSVYKQGCQGSVVTSNWKETRKNKSIGGELPYLLI